MSFDIAVQSKRPFSIDQIVEKEKLDPVLEFLVPDGSYASQFFNANLDDEIEHCYEIVINNKLISKAILLWSAHCLCEITDLSAKCRFIHRPTRFTVRLNST